MVTTTGGNPMKHDLEDMLEIIKRLEKRIIVLERAVESITSPITEDRWYWLH
jgi:organic radical activating enzyme